MKKEFVSIKQASKALKVSDRLLLKLCRMYPAVRRKQEGRQLLICIEELLDVLQKKT